MSAGGVKRLISALEEERESEPVDLRGFAKEFIARLPPETREEIEERQKFHIEPQERFAAFVGDYFDRPGKRESLGRALGEPVGDYLGCGALGCVYALRNGRVVKITSSEPEMRYWAWLAAEREVHPRELEAIPIIERIAWVDTDDGQKLGLVVREDLADAPWALLEKIEGALWEYASNAAASYRGSGFDTGSVRAALRELRAAAGVVYTMAPETRALGRTLAWLAEARAAPVDLHEENIGARSDGTLVIRDPGAVRVVHDEEIEEHLRANPCCDMLTANATEHYYVWTVKPRGENPIEGWGPYTNLANTKIHARIKAQKGKHDVTVTTDPRKGGFRVIRRYAAGTGETKQRG